MPEKGVEPSRACAQRILSPPRLPFRHSGAVAGSYCNTGLRPLMAVCRFCGEPLEATSVRPRATIVLGTSFSIRVPSVTYPPEVRF
jgi:hypothetical protein